MITTKNLENSTLIRSGAASRFPFFRDVRRTRINRRGFRDCSSASPCFLTLPRRVSEPQPSHLLLSPECRNDFEWKKERKKKEKRFKKQD